MTQDVSDFIVKLVGMLMLFGCVSRVASCAEHQSVQERLGYEARRSTLQDTRELHQIWERQRKEKR